MLLRLNTRHQLPQTGIRTTRGELHESSMVPARLHANTQLPKSNKTATQPEIQMNGYEGRRAYGARTLTDLTREFGQKGLADVRSGNSRHAQNMWRRAENGGKFGNDIFQQAWQEMFSKYSPTPIVGMELMGTVDITVRPSEVIGEPEIGDLTTDIETTPFARISATPGSVETYMRNEGFIRSWVTVDEYDIYA